MAQMKMGTTAQTYANAEYTFQVNPKNYNIPFSSNHMTTEMPFGKMHLIIGGGGVATRKIVLTGETYGTDRLTYYNNLAKQINKNEILRFWVSDTRFYVVKGKDISQTLQGGRTTFIDYVAGLECVLPYAQDNPKKQYACAISNANKTPLSDAFGSGKFENAGNAESFIKWTITSFTSSAITKVEIGDTSDFDTSPHKLVWNGSLAGGHVLVLPVYSFNVYGTRGTIKELRLSKGEIDGTESGNSYVEGDNAPWVDAGATDQSFSIKLTGCDAYTEVNAEWYPSYIG